MIKRFISVLLACLIIAAAAVPAFAASGTYVDFFEGIGFTDEQIKELDGTAKNVKYRYNFSAYYHMTDSIGSYDNVYDYAKNYFAQKSDKLAGVCFVVYLAYNEKIKSSTETVYLYVPDTEKTLFNEEFQQKIYDSYDEAGSYFEGVKLYYDCVSELLEANKAEIAEIVNNAPAVNSEDILYQKAEYQLVTDNTGTLSSIQREKLNEKLVKYSDECKCNFALAITASTDEMSVDDYAKKLFYDNCCGYGETGDGVLLLLSLGDKEGENDWKVFRTDGVYKFYSDKKVNKLMKPVVKKLAAKDFAGAADLYADSFRAEYGKGNRLSIIWLPLSFLIGFAIAYIVMKMKTAELKSVTEQRSANSYVAENSIVLKSSNDNLINKDVSRTLIAAAAESAAPSGRIDGQSGGSGHTTSGKF